MNLPESLSKFHSLELANNKNIIFTDLEWIELNDIGNAPYWDSTHKGFIAFAFSGRRDEWSLYNLDQSNEPIVLFCEKGDTGFVYAKNFEQAIVRLVLEELSGSWLNSQFSSLEQVDSLIRTYPYKLKPIIGEYYSSLLTNLIHENTISLNKENNVAYISNERAEEIIKNELSFNLIDEEIIHDIESPEYIELNNLTRLSSRS